MSKSMREKYPPGKRFRVVREGGTLSGLIPQSIPGSFMGWQRVLHVGDVIETLGYGPGWGSDPGYGIHFKDDKAQFVEFRPSAGSAFTFEPADGYLEEEA